MTTAVLAGVEVALDANGHLASPNDWTPAIGQAVAADAGIELTPKHWEVVNFAREDFATKGESPGLRRIAANTTVGMKELYKLFPKGPGKLVARIAGIPKPKSCL